MNRKIRIGLDFDGCINRLPFPFSYFSRHLSEKFVVPELIQEIIWKIIVHVPIIIDGRLLDIPKDVEVFIVSGRRNPSSVFKTLKDYDIPILCRGQNPVSELEWKITIAKMYKLDYFFDDRLIIIKGLKKAGIDVHDIRELVK